MKYSDRVGDWLVEMGYTTCFFVAGGSIMHAIESFRHLFAMRPTVHEVAAGIAAEYFNEISTEGRAFVLVTAGPGVTNLITALAGAYLESRELLVIGGQVKTVDLAHGTVRQRGIQEVDGVALAAAVTKHAQRLDQPAPRCEWERLVGLSRSGRRGPVFVELPLDVQASPLEVETSPATATAMATVPRTGSAMPQPVPDAVIDAIARGLRTAERPAMLLGGGLDRRTVRELRTRLATLGIPLLTTWNGADRIPEAHPMYFGRPNTWGQRSANLILQQCDELLVLGSRLGMQQTGFNWQAFAAGARVTQVELDPAELAKGHPAVAVKLTADANDVLVRLATRELGNHDAWVHYCRKIRALVPLEDPANVTRAGYLSPYEFMTEMSAACGVDDVIIPCSSGGAFTTAKQAFRLREHQLMVTNKGLAAMGYGLSGAIGAALAYPARRTVLFEGDGGFAQNLQEIGTVAANRLNLKMFVFDNGGYASIRMTQLNYFNGAYVGCDTDTGLGLPRWSSIFEAYGTPAVTVGPGFRSDASFIRHFAAPGPAAFLVRIDPEQTYWPKITSRVTADGSMVSEPLHRMSPPLAPETLREVGLYLRADD